MTSKNTYADLFTANEIAATAANEARKELGQFFFTRFKRLHETGRRVLKKEFGTERFRDLTARETGESLAWLLERNLYISKLNEDSVCLTNSPFAGKSSREYILKLDSIFGISDWDFASQVRKTVKHRIAVREEEDVINAEKVLRKAQREFNAAKAALEAAEKSTSQMNLKAEGARDRQSEPLHAIFSANHNRRDDTASTKK